MFAMLNVTQRVLVRLAHSASPAHLKLATALLSARTLSLKESA